MPRHRALPLLNAGLLFLWLTALIGYFAPWVHRQPVSAALAWTPFDLFALLRLLPEIEAGTLAVNLQALQLPLLALAVLLPALLIRFSGAVRTGAALVGCGLAAITMPPYPQILTAWRTPGWRVPFWWSIGTMATVLLMAWTLPSLIPGDRYGYRRWLLVGIIELAVLPAMITFYRLLPALRRLHAAPVVPAWGFWICIAGLSAIGAVEWYRAIRSWKALPIVHPDSLESGAEPGRKRHLGVAAEDAMSKAGRPLDLEHMRRIKDKYEEVLLQKANVVSVGIGLPIREGKPVDEPGIVVSVTRKYSPQELPAEDLVPQKLEDVHVYVEELGTIQAS